jgi:type II secretory pathway pseudopilin PulG
MTEERTEMADTSNEQGKSGTPSWLMTTVLGVLVAAVITTWFSQTSARAGDLEKAKTDLAVLQSKFESMAADISTLKSVTTSTAADISTLKGVTGETARSVQTLLDRDNQRRRDRDRRGDGQ